METTKIEKQDLWYQSLIEDCQTILVKGIWNYRLTLIRTYHLLGQSQRTIERAIQFVRKYPDLDLLPEGKNISWHKICNLYLPEQKKEILPLPEGKYQVILADPCWPYNERQDEKNLYGNTKYHYSSMSIEEIKKLPVKELKGYIYGLNGFLQTCISKKGWGCTWNLKLGWQNLINKNIAERLI